MLIAIDKKKNNNNKSWLWCVNIGELLGHVAAKNLLEILKYAMMESFTRENLNLNY